MVRTIIASGIVRIKTSYTPQEVMEQLIATLEDVKGEPRLLDNHTIFFKIPLLFSRRRGYVLKGVDMGLIAVRVGLPGTINIAFKLIDPFPRWVSILIPTVFTLLFSLFVSLTLFFIYPSLVLWQVFIGTVLIFLTGIRILAVWGKGYQRKRFQRFLRDSFNKNYYGTWPRSQFFAADDQLDFAILVWVIVAYVLIYKPIVQQMIWTSEISLEMTIFQIILLVVTLLLGVLFFGGFSWLYFTKSKYTPAFQRAVLKHKRYPKWMRKILEKWFALNQPEKVV